MENVTKTILANAFEELLSEKAFDSITVTDIVNRSGAARSTFYKHFTDKYDIMIYKYHEALNRIHNEDKGVDDWKEGTLSSLNYLNAHRNYFLKIIDYKGQNSVHDFFYNFSYEFTEKIICKKENVSVLPKREHEMLKVYLMGTSRYIMEWIKTNDIPPEELADMLCECMPEELKKYFK